MAPLRSTPRPVQPRDDALRTRTSAVLKRNLGGLSTAATNRMESDVSWFQELSAENRSWVGLIIQAGIRSFVDWWRTGDDSEGADTVLASAVFGAAPRALTGVINLQHTVDLVRLAIDVVEEHLDPLLAEDDSPAVHAALLLYGRELAFATARVYARAAEVRGAWDARLEALVVDSIVRGDADADVLSRASALGWTASTGVCVIVGEVPADAAPDLVGRLRHRALVAVSDVLSAIQGHRLVVVLGGVEDPLHSAAALLDEFGPGPVVAGPVVADLAQAHQSATEAVAAYDVAHAWLDAPRPTHALDLLPERLLAGDSTAADHLLKRVHAPLATHRSALVETLTAYFANGASIERTARALFVHANTVRYRLSQVSELTGCSPADPRDGFTLQIALVVGRQRTAPPPPAPAPPPAAAPTEE